jgi:hypothetical protein
LDTPTLAQWLRMMQGQNVPWIKCEKAHMQ